MRHIAAFPLRQVILTSAVKFSHQRWFCLALTALPVSADGASIRARAAWMRAPAGQAEVAAGYVTLDNQGADDRLVAAESTAAERVEVHDMSIDGGVMKMREAKEGSCAR